MTLEQAEELEEAGCCPGEVQSMFDAMKFLEAMASKPEVHAIFAETFRRHTADLSAIAMIHDETGGCNEQEH